jgi:ATP-binding cassette, subfamily C (CFTR/MRP), member 1
MSSLARCTIETQKGFGPTNEHCNGGFDFTLYFEETFLSITPFIVILPFLVFRLYRLYKAPIVVDGARWHLAKQVCHTETTSHIVDTNYLAL